MSKLIMVELFQGYLVIFNLHRANICKFCEQPNNGILELPMRHLIFTTSNNYYYYGYTA